MIIIAIYHNFNMIENFHFEQFIHRHLISVKLEKWPQDQEITPYTKHRNFFVNFIADCE